MSFPLNNEIQCTISWNKLTRDGFKRLSLGCSGDIACEIENKMIVRSILNPDSTNIKSRKLHLKNTLIPFCKEYESKIDHWPLFSCKTL